MTWSKLQLNVLGNNNDIQILPGTRIVDPLFYPPLTHILRKFTKYVYVCVCDYQNK